MHKVVIMRGVSGSGKSTYVKNNFSNASVCSADHYWIGKTGNYSFNPAKLDWAHACCYSSFVRALERQDPIIVVDNTNTTLVEIAPYLIHAKYCGYEVEIIRCTCPPETAAKRNVHSVPAKTVERMHKRMQITPSYKPWPKETVIETVD